MSSFKMRQAMVTAYKAGNFFTDANTAWPNVEFTPPKNAPWSKVTFLPVSSEVYSLGPTGNGQDRRDELMQVDLNYALNSGEGLISASVVAIQAYFYVGRKFTYAGQTVVCRSSSVSPGRIFEGFYRISVTIPFYGVVTR